MTFYDNPAKWMSDNGMATKRKLETVDVDGCQLRKIIESEKEKEIGKYKCSCGMIMTFLKEGSIEKHLQSKCHKDKVWYDDFEMFKPVYEKLQKMKNENKN